MKHKTIGVIGGLGPETGCRFCLTVNDRCKTLTARQPHILLDNLPISREAEERLINGGPSKEHFDLLIESIQRLNTLGVTTIVIACNTVHVFIDELRPLSKVPILSIIEETAKECTAQGFTKVGLLGTTRTITSGMHANELAKHAVEIIVPDGDDQVFVSACIIRIINHEVADDDKARLIAIIEKLKEAGAQAIVLGCTDLPLLLSPRDTMVPIIDSVAVLVDAAVRCLVKNQEEFK